MKEGWQLQGKCDKMVLHKNGNKIVFGIKANTLKGVLFFIRVKRNRETDIVALDIFDDLVEKKKTKRNKETVNLETVHRCLSHSNTKDNKVTVKHICIKLIDDAMDPYGECGIGKAE